MSNQHGKFYYLRADPVALRVDWQHVYMLGNQHLELSADESQKILNRLNAHLAEKKLELIALNSLSWYLRLEADPQISAQNPNKLIGQSIIDQLPSGANQTYWRQIFNEIQMLLHDFPGKIHALWFWGPFDQVPIPEPAGSERRKGFWRKVLGRIKG